MSNIIQAERKHYLNVLSGEEYSLVQNIHKFKSPIRNAESSSSDLCVIQGKGKDVCQDDAVVLKCKNSYFIGLFDGHGDMGREASTSCVYHMGRMNQKKLLSNPSTITAELITRLHDKLISTSDMDAEYSGSTATIALLHESTMHVSWVGDSKAILIIPANEERTQSVVFELTKNHDFSTEEEQNRIAEHGGILVKEDHGDVIVRRVVDPKDGEGQLPGLCMSRSIGDLQSMKFGCSNEPESIRVDFSECETIGDVASAINNHTLDEDTSALPLLHATLVVASDGVWDVMTHIDVCKYVSMLQKAGKSSSLSRDICLEAKRRWGGATTTDDMSCVATVLF